VLYTERGFEFVVVGYGHGVGLSQNGANYMANQGADFREILDTYYTGAQIVEKGIK
jgi:stage II sporulation protein D